jgi:hypothetical protein
VTPPRRRTPARTTGAGGRPASWRLQPSNPSRDGAAVSDPGTAPRPVTRPCSRRSRHRNILISPIRGAIIAITLSDCG